MGTTRQELLDRRRALYRRLEDLKTSGAGEEEIEALESAIERLEQVLI